MWLRVSHPCISVLRSQMLIWKTAKNLQSPERHFTPGSPEWKSSKSAISAVTTLYGRKEGTDPLCILNLEPRRSSDPLSVLGNFVATSYFILTPLSIAVVTGSKFVRHVDNRQTITKLISRTLFRHCPTRLAVGHPSNIRSRVQKFPA